MALAVEPMVTLGRADTDILEDEWTVVTTDGSWAAHFEHTFTLLPDGAWVLTALDGGREALERPRRPLRRPLTADPSSPFTTGQRSAAGGVLLVDLVEGDVGGIVEGLGGLAQGGDVLAAPVGLEAGAVGADPLGGVEAGGEALLEGADAPRRRRSCARRGR